MLPCPQCGSGQVQNLPLAYQTHTWTGSSTSSTAIIGSGNLGGAYAYTSGQTRGQTNLATRLGPPERQNIGVAPLFWLLGSIPLLGLVYMYSLVHSFAFLPTAGFIALTWWAVRRFHSDFTYNENHFREDLQRWNSSALCLRCGAIYEAQ
jgi:hypothetical protein